MLTKLSGALLLTVGAMAVDDNCIELYEDGSYEGTTVTLCYASKDEESLFYLMHYDIESIGSYKAGQSTAFSFCYIAYYWFKNCYEGVGPEDNSDP